MLASDLMQSMVVVLPFHYCWMNCSDKEMQTRSDMKIFPFSSNVHRLDSHPNTHIAENAQQARNISLSQTRTSPGYGGSFLPLAGSLLGIVAMDSQIWTGKAA
jgi:hypothetical protein